MLITPQALTEIFEKYGTRGTWYAHASVGCLHVRPVLDMKLGADVKKMRAIAEDAFALVRQYGGSHSGEHGDGIVRSEFNEVMFGPKMAELFRRVKTCLTRTVCLIQAKLLMHQTWMHVNCSVLPLDIL